MYRMLALCAVVAVAIIAYASGEPSGQFVFAQDDPFAASSTPDPFGVDPTEPATDPFGAPAATPGANPFVEGSDEASRGLAPAGPNAAQRTLAGDHAHLPSKFEVTSLGNGSAVLMELATGKTWLLRGDDGWLPLPRREHATEQREEDEEAAHNAEADSSASQERWARYRRQLSSQAAAYGRVREKILRGETVDEKELRRIESEELERRGVDYVPHPFYDAYQFQAE